MLKFVRPAVALVLVTALGGCYASPGAFGPMPYPPATAVLQDGQAVAGYAGTTCAAGFYICQVPQQPVGTPCACPGLGAASYGAVR